MRNEMNIKICDRKTDIYYVYTGTNCKVIWQIRMCTGFQVLKDTEKSGKALALPFCKRFLRKLSASGRWTNRKTIRQTLSNRFWKSRKVQHLFLHNLPEKKKMNNTWQYSFIKRIPPVMIRLPIEMRMNIPVHERIKILVIWKWWRRTGHAW